MNDFEKAILWLELVESGMSTLEASRKARELCGSRWMTPKEYEAFKNKVIKETWK